MDRSRRGEITPKSFILRQVITISHFVHSFRWRNLSYFVVPC